MNHHIRPSVQLSCKRNFLDAIHKQLCRGKLVFTKGTVLLRKGRRGLMGRHVLKGRCVLKGRLVLMGGHVLKGRLVLKGRRVLKGRCVLMERRVLKGRCVLKQQNRRVALILGCTLLLLLVVWQVFSGIW